MPAIAWVQSDCEEHGSWGPPEALSLPCDARGVLLAEGLFETVLVLAGQGQLLDAHHERWRDSAALLGLAPPPEQELVQELLQQASRRSGISTGALRLNWCRGSGSRGLQAPDPAQEDRDAYLFWLQLSALKPSFAPATVIVSPTEVRQASSLLSRCKTFGYGSSLIARRQASSAGADDALLTSSDGTLCCGSSANLLVQGSGGDDLWLTPPLTSGCLPGIMRQRALERGLAREATLPADALNRSDQALLINSLGCRPVRLLERGWLNDSEAQANRLRAEQFWRSLLSD